MEADDFPLTFITAQRTSLSWYSPCFFSFHREDNMHQNKQNKIKYQNPVCCSRLTHKRHKVVKNIWVSSVYTNAWDSHQVFTGWHRQLIQTLQENMGRHMTCIHHLDTYSSQSHRGTTAVSMKGNSFRLGYWPFKRSVMYNYCGARTDIPSCMFDINWGIGGCSMFMTWFKTLCLGLKAYTPSWPSCLIHETYCASLSVSRTGTEENSCGSASLQVGSSCCKL